jgi:hypothetical protein
MLFKVTPNLELKSSQENEVKEKQPRKKRKAAIYDAEGNEVLITMMCLKCKSMKPLLMFGLRKMADGCIRNQPWCRNCRSGASAAKKQREEEVVETPASDAPASVEVASASNPATT